MGGLSWPDVHAEKINGVEILRTYLYVPNRPGRARNRVMFDTSFALSAMIGGLVSGPIDVVIAISPPVANRSDCLGTQLD